jgi:heme-degrading monooxygenase HmoA
VIASTIRFRLPEDTDWDGVRRLARERAALYAAVPGLRSKAFLLDPERHEYGANYVWESREALDAFLRSDLFQGAVARFGAPDVRIHEIPVYVDQGSVHAR